MFSSHRPKSDAFALFDDSARWRWTFETLAPVVPARLWRDRIVQNPCQIKAVSRQRGQTGIEATTLPPMGIMAAPVHDSAEKLRSVVDSCSHQRAEIAGFC
ncbi:unnamed protein product [Cercospora beticola]|nr:unnamed protein product [Cercospora beticola]